MPLVQMVGVHRRLFLRAVRANVHSWSKRVQLSQRRMLERHQALSAGRKPTQAGGTASASQPSERAVLAAKGWLSPKVHPSDLLNVVVVAGSGCERCIFVRPAPQSRQLLAQHHQVRSIEK